MGYNAFFSTHFYDKFIAVIRYFDFYSDLSNETEPSLVKIRDIISAMHDKYFKPSFKQISGGDDNGDITIKIINRNINELIYTYKELEGHRFYGAEVSYHTEKFDNAMHLLALKPNITFTDNSEAFDWLMEESS